MVDLGTLVEAATPVIALMGWTRLALGGDPNSLTWMAYDVVVGVAIVVAAGLSAQATVLLWVGIRRSRRRIGGNGSPWLAVALLISALIAATEG